MTKTHIRIISFTRRGGSLAQRIEAHFKEGTEAVAAKAWESRALPCPLKEWCRQSFTQSQALIFVGAAGIAVRLIAPYIKDKFEDPAVLVTDEEGRFVIPILSGHAGGGNQLAAWLAERLGAIPVITTATDLQRKFAVDVFAVKNQLAISERKLAKKISAAMLEGETIHFFCERKVIGTMPAQLYWEEDFCQNEDVEEEKKPLGIYVGIHQKPLDGRTLFLCPKAVVLGIGCKKGKSMEELDNFVRKKMEKWRLSWDSIMAAATIDCKKRERGLTDFCQKHNISFWTFSAQELAKAPGIFTESAFVERTVGVGNVCERAAMRGAMELAKPALIQRKEAENGMTLAAAEIEWSVEFESIICSGNWSGSL